MKVVGKGTFPALLKKLTENVSSSNLVSGFRATGLWPLNKDLSNCLRKTVINEVEDEDQEGSPLLSPKRKLREAIVNAIAPPMSESTAKAITSSNRKRKRIQASVGEILTSEEAVKRLKCEAKTREEIKN